MAKPKTNHQAYLDLMSLLTSQGERFPKAALARMLGLPRQSVDQWKNIVPESQALKVSILTGIPIQDLRPETIVEAHSLKRKHENEKAKATKASQGT
jgi:DNA-binding transcriptional regulator YdaS (Cro superfamily)